MSQQPPDKHLEEAELSGAARKVFEQLKKWVEEEEPSFEAFGESKLIKDDRFGEACQPLFNEISKQMKNYDRTRSNIARITSPNPSTLNSSNIDADLIPLRIISGSPKIDEFNVEEKIGKIIHITKAVQVTAGLDLIYFFAPQ